METFLAGRAFPSAQLLSVGKAAQGTYIADKGFAGDKPHARWHEQYGAELITPPHQTSKRKWSKEWRRWLADLASIG